MERGRHALTQRDIEKLAEPHSPPPTRHSPRLSLQPCPARTLPSTGHSAELSRDTRCSVFRTATRVSVNSSESLHSNRAAMTTRKPHPPFRYLLDPSLLTVLPYLPAMLSQARTSAGGCPCTARATAVQRS